MTTSQTRLGSPRSWFVWTIAMVAYITAVLHRTSFGVASADAAVRFNTGAGLVSLFAMVQLLTYALMQLPSGVASDRFGSRVTVAVGAVIMGLGQLDLALANSIPVAIFGRVLVATGDSLTFGPVVKLVNAWFQPKRIPVLVQITGQVGQLGQVLSAVPFAYLLGTQGWTSAFLGLAGWAGVVAVIAAVLLRNAPDGATRPISTQPALASLGDVIANPGVQTGMWCHWLNGGWALVVSMMWGFPFMSRAEGFSPQQIGLFFTVMTASGVAAGIAVGAATARWPRHRVLLALVTTALAAVPWAAVLASPSPAPFWLFIVLAVGLGTGNPGSGIGFDIARTSVRLDQAGTANGFVIMGGFLWAMFSIGTIGAVLDARGGDWTGGDFRLAFATQFIFTAIGLLGIWRSQRAVNSNEGN